MFKNYFKIAIRNLKREKTYSIINIFGLSIGMSAFVLIALLTQFMNSYDKFNENYKRIYRVQQEVRDNQRTEWTQTIYPLARDLKNSFPEIEESAVIREIWSEYISAGTELIIKDENGFLADPQILNILSFSLIKGDTKTVLAHPGTCVLSKSLAEKLFPGAEAIGKMIKGSFTRDLIVTGIFDDLPYNSHIRPSYLVSFSTMDKVWARDYRGYRNDYGNNAYRTYLLLKENVDPDEFSVKIKDFLDAKIVKNETDLYLKPLGDVKVNPTREASSNTPLPYYAAISIFILLLACINFINLTTARSNLREKEIGVRKVVGGNRWSLVNQFLGESFIVSIPAIVLAFIMVKFYLPAFNSQMQTQLTLNFTDNWQYILFIIITLILVGMLAGLYPAFYLSSLRPLSILKGNITGANALRVGRGTIRKVLVAFQFLISITLILSTYFIFKQVDYMKSKDLGFNKTNLLRCYIEMNDSKSNFKNLRAELLENPDIIDASVSFNSPCYGVWGRSINWEGGTEDQSIYTLFNRADYNFINTFQMKLAEGRNFSKDYSTDSSACLINETLAALIGWENPVGKKLWDNRYTVIGVIKDFHQVSVHQEIPPYLMLLHNGEMNRENDYSIRIAADDILKSISFVRNKFKSFFPNEVFEVQLYDTGFDRETQAVWEGVQNTFGFFSAMAIIIAVIGLLGLVSFSTRRRTKEIGIRKVLGATESGLYFLVTKEFLILLGAAILFAAPAAYIILVTAPGAYKYSLTTLDFVFPLIAVIIATVIVTLRQVLSVTKANPAGSLHYE